MIYDVSFIAVLIFTIFVGAVVGLSFYFGRKTKSASSYFAAGGTIHWGVNGIAFAGDYLSAASFLGICGMIAFSGYDGFLYSIGFLAGWVVALFIVAEPLKRLGKFTFTDALDAKFNSRGIKLSASISTLVVSVFYLIPQMVGAGDLVVPLLGLPHWAGVVIVGSIVTLIVTTAGMTSTTYVQFIKGGLLIIFSTVLTFYILNNGISLKPSESFKDYNHISAYNNNGSILPIDSTIQVLTQKEVNGNIFVKIKHENYDRWFQTKTTGEEVELKEMLSITTTASGEKLYNGASKEARNFFQVGNASKIIVDGVEVEKTGALNPVNFFTTIEDTEISQFTKTSFADGEDQVLVWPTKTTKGSDLLKPGQLYKLKGATWWQKINFISLMLALFLGTSALPHILIRYYTVPSQRDARKSTIVAIAAIGAFYVLTLFMGLGAMLNGVIDVESSNMSAPLLAKYFGVGIFSIISAIAFSTILGTVAGLIVASTGAIAHDIMDKYMKIQMTDHAKVRAGKISAVVVGVISILLGIFFKGMNVSFLVGLAFAVAASANLPAIIMILFWDKTTAKGITASIVTGIVSSVGIIALSPTMFERYGLNPASAIIPIDNPGIFSIPLSFLVLVIVSLYTQKKNSLDRAV